MKKSNICKRCKIEINYKSIYCRSCNGKIRIGKANSNYKHGKTNNTKCLNCKKRINSRSKNLLCRKCWLKSRLGYKHNKFTILKMKKYWERCRKYIFLTCKHCHKKFKIISWKIFRIFCSKKCSADFTKGTKRDINLYLRENNGNWKGGISFLPYSLDFNKNLKNRIRKRDSHKCRLCNIKQEELDRKLDIHHIDYNKKNCREINLISLCQRCHLKTNGIRDYWFAYFVYITKNKIYV